ncbi:MAG TPA: VTT domain-containing protein [Thermoanaerobaculia bacterium]|nr:VTT domain-containing protein [Thermoanaerobaculia bacterium]
MKRFWLLTGMMMAVFLALFGLAEALHVPLLTDPSPWLSRNHAAAALAGFGLLVGDVVLPVPSSLVMMAHGALFGVAGGTLLSLAGALGAGLFGFAIGRRGGPLYTRLVPEEERRRADALLREWGDLAIVVTRPIPILAETVAILAGASPLGWGRMTAATLAGSLPAALIYALTGAAAARLDNVALIFSLVLLVAGLFWVIGRRLRSGDERTTTTRETPCQ